MDAMARLQRALSLQDEGLLVLSKTSIKLTVFVLSCLQFFIGMSGCTQFPFELNNQTGDFVGRLGKAGATSQHLSSLIPVPLIDFLGDFARFGVKILMHLDQVHKGGAATKFCTPCAVQPFAHLTAVVPADRFGIEVSVFGCRSPEFGAPVRMRLDGIVQINAHIT
jgi:hypothetical protein